MRFLKLINANIIPFLIITIVSVLVCLPLLKPGFYQVHDDQQIARLYEYDQTLKSGQFPPRWVQDFGFGYGYPLFVFYPSLVYATGEVFHFAGFGYVDSIKLVFAASIIISGFGMYLLVKQITKENLEATVAGIFYILVPYRAIDVYIRGALAESFSFVFLPLILWAFYKLGQKTSLQSTIFSAIFLGALMVTHNLIFLPFMMLFPIYILYLLFNSQEKKQFILAVVASSVLALTLSAFFWLPSLVSKNLTIVDELLLINLASYKIHFVYPQQLWNWPWGFGGSGPGLTDGLSFKVGKLHIISAIFALILTLIYSLKNKTKFTNLFRKKVVIFFVLFILSAIMSTYISKPIWDLITPLQYLQFPWRFLTFTALFSSILAGLFIYKLKLPFIKLLTSVIFILFLLSTNLKLFKPQVYRFDLTDQKATAEQTIKWDVSMSSFEYIPKGVELVKNNLGANTISISENQVEKDRVQVLSGDAQIYNLQDKPNLIKFSLNAKTDSEVLINSFNFPFWQAKIDNQEVTPRSATSLKLMALEVPQGSHIVTITFKNTPIMNFANMVSLGSVAIIFALALHSLWKVRKF